ncbi:MAG: hypothetical protein KJ666_18075 [Bacteroidetes bacterium]|nr:hypothetical protein [Bacteroidota bacterium]
MNYCTYADLPAILRLERQAGSTFCHIEGSEISEKRLKLEAKILHPSTDRFRMTVFYNLSK